MDVLQLLLHKRLPNLANLNIILKDWHGKKRLFMLTSTFSHSSDTSPSSVLTLTLITLPRCKGNSSYNRQQVKMHQASSFSWKKLVSPYLLHETMFSYLGNSKYIKTFPVRQFKLNTADIWKMAMLLSFLTVQQILPNQILKCTLTVAHMKKIWHIN